MPWVEGCALVTLCSYRSVTRRLSLALLKETRVLHETLKVQVGRVLPLPLLQVYLHTVPPMYMTYMYTAYTVCSCRLNVPQSWM